MKRFIINFYNYDMGKLGRYPYYDYDITSITIPEILNVLAKSGQIALADIEAMTQCKCIMIEEDN